MKIIEKSIKLTRELFDEVYDSKKQKNWHFAFAYRKNKLLAIGQNNMRCPEGTAFKFAKKFSTNQLFPTRHAEVDLISRLWGKLYIDSSIKLVIIRLNRFGEMQNSKPCKHCQIVLDALNIKKIYYSTVEGIYSI
jgi:hypothetical protein